MGGATLRCILAEFQGREGMSVGPCLWKQKLIARLLISHPCSSYERTARPHDQKAPQPPPARKQKEQYPEPPSVPQVTQMAFQSASNSRAQWSSSLLRFSQTEQVGSRDLARLQSRKGYPPHTGKPEPMSLPHCSDRSIDVPSRMRAQAGTVYPPTHTCPATALISV